VICDRDCHTICDECAYDLERAKDAPTSPPPSIDHKFDHWRALGDGARVFADDQLDVHFTRMADVEPEDVSWLWPGRIPFGKLTVLDGDPKTGKSTMMLDLAARLSTGSPFPDGHRLDGPADVVLLTAEDGLADTVRPRLDAAGANVKRIAVLDWAKAYDKDGTVTERPPSLPRDLPDLETFVTRHGAALVIIDVLNAFLGADVDGYKDQDVRRALMPLAKMAERTGAAIVAIRHLTKQRTGNALYAGGGSIGIVGAARSVLLVAVDPDDDDRRVMASVACNIAAPVSALGFRLVADEHGSKVVWLGDVAHTADALVSPRSGEDRTARDEAAEWLGEFLADGARPATDVKDAATAAGINPRTLRRAKKQGGVEHRKDGSGPWFWCLEGGQPLCSPSSKDARAQRLNACDLCSQPGLLRSCASTPRGLTWSNVLRSWSPTTTLEA
jgi:AAA domain